MIMMILGVASQRLRWTRGANPRGGGDGQIKSAVTNLPLKPYPLSSALPQFPPLKIL